MKSGRDTVNFNLDWKFCKNDTTGAEYPDFDDSNWKLTDLPHDWSIEGPFSKEWASGTGYLPAGIGWYRKSFRLPSGERGRKVFILFDGVYCNSEVWINGNYLGMRPNGYISFSYDLTPFIRFGKENTLAIKVDHSKFADSRWYTGSGIYRSVKLITTDPAYIEQWGVYANITEVNEKMAEMDIEVSVLNEAGMPLELTLHNYLVYGSDTVSFNSSPLFLNSSERTVAVSHLECPDPRLWDIDEPNLYNLVTVLRGDNINDAIVTPIGFRYFSFDPDSGFSLNGRNIKMKGICLHHDAGTLGAAVYPEVIEKRLDLLKEMGCNAIRTSHNPFSTDFLDLCDRKGFIVINEAFDEWELPKKKWIDGWNRGEPGLDGYSEWFEEWAVRDLTDFVLRDRNHPSVIMWSIGNEVDYPNDPYTHPVLNIEANPQTWAKFNTELPHADRLGIVANKLVATIKKYDNSRPVTAGLASALMSNETGYAEALDVAGYNYQEFRYSDDHEKYPGRILYGSENGMSLEAWNTVADNDYVAGQFLWTGFEYLGEAGQFPSRHSTSGVIDLAGNRKPEFYFRQSLWSEKPMVFIGTTAQLADRGPVNLWSHKRVEPVWNWEEGRNVSVNIFTNCEEVELFLNDESQGIKKSSDFMNRTLTWTIPFSAGVLRAVAKNANRSVAEYELHTTGEPSAIVAECDRSSIAAGRQNIAAISATIRDQNGNVVYDADNEIFCEITGPARLIGMEDSNPRNTEDYKDNRQKAYHGRLLIYIQSLDDPGKVTVTLSSANLKGTSVSLDVEKI